MAAMLLKCLTVALATHTCIRFASASQYNAATVPATTAVPPAQQNLRVLLSANAPWVTVESNGTLSGFDPDVMQLLSVVANFTYSLSLQPDRLTGALLANGTWDGMIGQIIAGNYDVSGHNTITSARTQVVDFTTPLYSSQLRILVNTQDNIANVNYLVRGDSSKSQFLQGSTDPKYQAIWQNIVKNNGFVSSDTEGVNKVLAGGFAYVAPIPDLNDFLAANPGKIQLTSDILYTSYSAWVTHLGSPFRQMLSVAVSQIAESGDLSKLLSKYKLSI